jgi:hypothetical protein
MYELLQFLLMIGDVNLMIGLIILLIIFTLIFFKV